MLLASGSAPRPGSKVLLALMVALGGGAANARPRLGVMLVFDQLSSGELDALGPLLPADGFGGLMGRGAARFDATYSFAATETGPGHATLSTGANPPVHGICANQWFEGAKATFAVDDPAHPVIGAHDGAGRSARFLRAGTLGDAMKAQSGGRAKVISISLKDRAAILSGGPSADLALWYDSEQGRFTSSDAFVAALPRWAQTLGEALPQKSFATGRWSPLPLPPPVRPLAPADQRAGEGAFEGFTQVFPHDLAAVPANTQASTYRATPQAMNDLFTLALAAIDAEHLGEDLEPDLLILSISPTDYVGHTYGPGSAEKVDLLRRADAAVRRFLVELDRRFKPAGYSLVVSSDHGVVPLVEQMAKSHIASGRISWSGAVSAVERAIAATPGAAGRVSVLGYGPPHLSLAFDTVAPSVRDRVLEAVAKALEAVPGVERVFRADASPTPGDSVSSLMHESTAGSRCGALLVQSRPYFIVGEGERLEGTAHASAQLYDRRVPLFVLGSGVRKGRYATPVDPRDVAPTLAFLLEVDPPACAQGVPVPAVGAP